MTKLKFEGKTFYLYVSQKEVSAGFLLFRRAEVLGWFLMARAEQKCSIQVELSHLHAKPRPRSRCGGEGGRGGKALEHRAFLGLLMTPRSFMLPKNAIKIRFFCFHMKISRK